MSTPVRSPEPPPPTPHAPGIHLHLSTGAAIILSVAFLALVGLIVRSGLPGAAPTPTAASRPEASSNPGTPASAHPERSAPVPRSRLGPWGDLEYYRILLERPDEFLTTGFSSVLPTRWFFEGRSAEDLAALFEACNLPDVQKRRLLDRNRWQITAEGITLEPGSDLILEMHSAARKQIYSVLANSPANYFHHSPSLLHLGTTDDWFKESGLRPETEALIKKLIYRSDNSLVFAYLPEVYAACSSPEERRRLIKTLSRNDTLIIKLMISETSDIEALVDYWSTVGRAKDIRPLLESLARVPGGASIDIAHLLPPLARRLLYTFPYPTDGRALADRNCFWTALNFFNEEPNENLRDAKATETTIQQDYFPIQDDPVFGDVILLLDSREAVIHASVFIADDKVFTKNGRDFTEPWKITSVTEMLSEYSWNEPVRPVVYRLKRP